MTVGFVLTTVTRVALSMGAKDRSHNMHGLKFCGQSFAEGRLAVAAIEDFTSLVSMSSGPPLDHRRVELGHQRGVRFCGRSRRLLAAGGSLSF